MRMKLSKLARPVTLPLLVMAAGCASPYYTDRGALLGGAGGAGVGALVGSASGHAGTGALIGAGVGALSGGLVGNGLDQIEARNRAQIAAQMGRQLPPGGVQVNDVIAMSQSRVDEELIVNHVRSNGMAHPLQAGELIALEQQGVSKNVILAMQSAPPRVAAPPAAVVAPGPVYYYPPPPPMPYYPAPSVGFAVGGR
ncbi:MAG TPA: glycine zipper domain-containing protein [Pirellulales bacterium]|nr:glycine zipper domain-containing protein [Pirellulales bacterium]